MILLNQTFAKFKRFSNTDWFRHGKGTQTNLWLNFSLFITKCEECHLSLRIQLLSKHIFHLKSCMVFRDHFYFYYIIGN